MDISHETMPGLEAALLRSRTILLKQIVDAAGTTLTDTGALTSLLGIWSTRLVERVVRERRIQKNTDYMANYRRGTKPDPEGPFPDLHLTSPAKRRWRLVAGEGQRF